MNTCSINSFPYYLFLIIIFVSSCDQKTELDTKAISREVKSRKIKKIAEVDILDLAGQKGKKTVAIIEKNWHSALKNSLDERGEEYAKKFCIVPFIPKYDSLAKFSESIRKIGSDNTIGKSKADSIEILIAEAYQYNRENNVSLKPNVQRLGETYILYTSPIFFDKEYCGNCHSPGENSKNITNSPDKYAGFWSIKFSKKQLIEGTIVD